MEPRLGAIDFASPLVTLLAPPSATQEKPRTSEIALADSEDAPAAPQPLRLKLLPLSTAERKIAARRLRGSRKNGQFVLRQQDPAALLAVGRYRQSLLTTVLVLPIAADDILSPALQQIDIPYHG